MQITYYRAGGGGGGGGGAKRPAHGSGSSIRPFPPSHTNSGVNEVACSNVEEIGEPASRFHIYMDYVSTVVEKDITQLNLSDNGGKILCILEIPERVVR